MKRDYLFGEPRENVIRLDDYRRAEERDTMRSIGEIAAELVRNIEARCGKN